MTSTNNERDSLADKVRLILAPIRGVTDVVYREAFAGCFGGFDEAVAPFVPLKQGHSLRPVELQQLAPDRNRCMPVCPQVLTNHPPTFSAVLRELRDVGHEEVNWNLGCPHPAVVGRGRGAGLLSEPNRIDAILADVLKDAPVRLSVKLRLGYHDPDEFVAVMEVLNRYPLARVILHARTADQMYDGAVDMERAAQVLALCRHPFVFNGDITHVAEFSERRRKLPGTASWMVGRGALGNPFLPALLKGAPPLSVAVRRGQLIKFHGLLFDGYGRMMSGARHQRDKMMEQWDYLSRSFADPGAVLARIRRSSYDQYESVVDWVFGQPLA